MKILFFFLIKILSLDLCLASTFLLLHLSFLLQEGFSQEGSNLIEFNFSRKN